MCPDRQMISVFIDGELPSPWKEKMESHLAGCTSCEKYMENFKRIFAPVKEAATEEKALMEAAKDRVWQNMAGSLKTRKRIVAKPCTFAGIWRRKVSVSLPAAAAAMILVVMAAFLAGDRFTSRPAGIPFIAPSMANVPMAVPSATIGGGAPIANMILSSEEALPNIVPAADTGGMNMSGLLQYLGGFNTGDILILHLPYNRNFTSSGEPVMIKAAGYQRR